jgi:uncharacterized protein (TIGR02996 family)
MGSLLESIHTDPADRSAWLAVADWLEENGGEEEAELVRTREALTISASREGALAGMEARLRQLLVRGVKPIAAQWKGMLGQGVAIRFSLIPPGELVMGSPPDEDHRYDNEGPCHLVRITRPFYMGVYPVTQEQFRAVTGLSPSHYTGQGRPVDSVDWNQAEEFCIRASEVLGREVRLPTEAEWEFACRGGTTTMYHTGNGDQAMRRAGWCSRTSPGSARGTRPVGQFLPNPWGLYDMHGNVREWCLDGERAFSLAAQVDPVGPSSGTGRMVRGGSWYYTAEDCRSASRYSRPMSYRLEYYGFRVVLSA